MNAQAIRELYDYHFNVNHRVWEECISQLSDTDFLRHHDYSLGSIRNHTVHMMSVDERWFARLEGQEVPPLLFPESFMDRDSVRHKWDSVEAQMRAYLSRLTDETAAALVHYPTSRRGPAQSIAWQILVHVVNHGTDHRAQMLTLLYSMGAPTLEQDYMLYLWENE